MNRAEWAGYSTADQYLAYLQKQTAAWKSLNAAMLDRTALYKQNTDAALAYYNALKGTHSTIGQLGGDNLSGVQALNDALVGLPDQVTTQVTVDTSQAMAEIAAYRTALDSIPRLVGTTGVLTETSSDGTGTGTVPVRGAYTGTQGGPAKVTEGVTGIYKGTIGGPAPLTDTVSLNDRDARAQLAAFTLELNHMPKAVEITADFNDAKAMADAQAFYAFIEKHRNFGVTETLSNMVASGAAGGGGGPPPVKPTPGAAPDEPNPNDIHAAQVAEDNLAKALIMEHLAAQQSAQANKDAGDSAAASAKDFLALAAAANNADDAYKYAMAAAVAAKDATADSGKAADTASKSMSVLGIAMTKAGTAGFGLQLALAGGLLGTVGVVHLAIDAIFEALAVLVPALVTMVVGLTAWGAAAYSSATQVVDRMKAVQTAATATGQAIYPLTGQFQALQDAVRPQVWQLFGDGINLVSNRGGILNRLIMQTGAEVDRLAGRFVAFMNGAGKGLQTFFGAGAHDLAQFGQILVNLGNAFMNVLKVMNQTHTDQYLLSILVVLSKVIDLISRLPVPLLAVVVGLHSIWLWGGLISTVFLQMLNPIRSVAVALAGIDATKVASDASGFTRLKAVLSDIGSAFAALPARIGLASKATGEAETAAAATSAAMSEEAAAMSGVETAAGGAAGATGIGGLLARLGGSGGLIGIAVVAALALAAVGVKLGFMHDQTMTWLTSLNKTLMAASIFQAVGTAAQQLAGVTRELSIAQKTGVGNVTELASGQRSLQTELGTSIDRVGTISRLYGTNFVGALALLNTAGVTTNQLFSQQAKVWAGAEQQVAGLVTGYRAMGQGLTQLQGDVSVQLVMGSDQLKQMQTLNGVWDQWLTLVDAGPSALVPYLQSVQTLSTNLKAAGASLGGLNANSLTARATFDQMIPQMGTVQDAIRTYSAVLQNGAQGSADLVTGTKDLISSSGLLSTSNQQVRNSLIAVAEQADPSINTWQKLTKWVGHEGAARAAQELDDMMTRLQTPTANLSADAMKLTTALQDDLNPAMASAIFNAKGGQQAFNNYATAFQKFGSSGGPTIQAARQVAQELLAIDGNSATAKSQFIGFSEAMGMSSKQANALWQQLTTGKDAVTATSGAADQLRQKMGGAVQATAQLASPGLWGQIEHAFMAFWDTAYHLTLAGGIEIGHAFEAAWDGMVNWFIQSVPHAFGTAWNAVWSNTLAPVIRAFDAVEGFIASSFDGWWKTHGTALEDIWNAVWGTIKNTAMGVWTPIKDAAQAFWDWLSGLMRGGGALGDIWKGFQEAGAQAWQWLKVAASDFAATMAQVFTGIGHAFQAVWAVATAGFKIMWDGIVAAAKIAWDVIVGIVSVVIDLITGHWHQAWKDILTTGEQVWNALKTLAIQVWNAILDAANKVWQVIFKPLWGLFTTNLVQPLQHFFGTTVPGWWNDFTKFASTTFHTILSDFTSVIYNNFVNFFTKDIPNWWNDMLRWGVNTWHSLLNNFTTIIYNNFVNFFTRSIPNWFNDLLRWGINTWHSLLNNFTTIVYNNFVNFFTKSVPNWFSSFGNFAKRTWQNAWTDFKNDLLNPIGNWFTNTLPHGLENAFKSGVNGVIGIINKVIDTINKIIGIIPGVPHIGHIPPLASGGPVPTGGGGGRVLAAARGGSIPGPADSDNIMIKAMGGEYMLRQPARMAIEQDFGRGFLDRLNHYDTLAGGGSRGILASQRGYASGGQIAADAEKYVGHRYVYGGPSNPQGGWDCSSFASYVLGHDLNMGIPGGSWASATNSGRSHGPVASQYMTWGGASNKADQNPAHAAPGDLLTWNTHVGFARGPNQMISAYDTAYGTANTPIAGAGPSGERLVIRQVSGSGGGGFLGFVEGIGSALTSFGKSVLGVVGGSVSALEKLAMQGADAVFDFGWSHAVQPILGAILGHIGWPGQVGMAGAGEMKTGIDNWLKGWDQQQAAASLGSVAPGAPNAGVAAEQAYAASLLPQYGWPGSDMSSLIALWNQESGWNPNAVNPSSGAYGIPQALGHGHPYNLGDWKNQIVWGLNYIRATYGNPVNAENHELAYHWYATGGPVIAAIKAATTDNRLREAMGIGSYVESQWNPAARHGNSYGPYLINLGTRPSGQAVRNAQDPQWATKYALPYYTKAMAAAGGSTAFTKNPRAAAILTASIAEHMAQFNPGTPGFYVSPGGGAVDTGWNEVMGQLGLNQSTFSTTGTSTGKVSGDSAAWGADAKAVVSDWAAFFPPWNTLYREPRPRGFTNAQWAQWQAEMAVAARSEAQLQGAVSAFKNPSSVRQSTFDTARNAMGVSMMGGILSGHAPAQQYWTSKQAPSAFVGKAAYPGQMAAASSKFGTWANALFAAESAWQAMQGDVSAGSGGGGSTPGAPPTIVPRALATPAATTATPVALQGYATMGGPDSGVTNKTGPGGDMGFAAGGGVGLSQVASMFPVMMPGGGVGYMPMTMPAGQMSALAKTTELPRTMSAAAAGSGNRVGLNVEQLTISNPVPEQPSQSITRAANRLGFLAGRGPV